MTELNIVLKNKRKALGLTQRQVAKRANLLPQQYQKLERGERNIATASFDVACKVLTALEFDVSTFYFLYVNQFPIYEEKK